MWVVIFIAGIIVLLMIALLGAYLDLRDTVEIMRSTINWQNKRYVTCLEGWEKALQSVKEMLSLNDQVIELNKKLYSDLYGNEEDNNEDNNEDEKE